MPSFSSMLERKKERKPTIVRDGPSKRPPKHSSKSSSRQMKHKLTPVVTPRNPSENKKNDENILTEQEEQDKASGKLPCGAENFLDLRQHGRFQFVQYLGHGSYGHVCEGTDIETKNRVAIKKIDKVFNNDIDAKRLLRELRILRTLRNHENIVNLVYIIKPNNLNEFNSITLIFEFVDTDLAKLVQSDQYFTTLHVQYMLYQMLLGIKYMHSADIAHRDLKPANILVNENCTLKICDFGLARGLNENMAIPRPVSQIILTEPSLEEKQQQAQTAQKRNKLAQRGVTKHVVTRWYRAPEVILLQQQRPMLKAVDMWSVGCIFAELLQMKRENCLRSQRQPIFPGRSSFPLSANDPFAWADRDDQLNVIFDVIGTPKPEDIESLTDEKAKRYLYSLPKKSGTNFKTLLPSEPDLSIQLLKSMLEFNVNKRLSADEALAHPYLQRVRDRELERLHPPINFEFEDVPVTLHQLRALIIDEICHFNPDLLQEIQRRHAEYRYTSARAKKTQRQISRV